MAGFMTGMTTVRDCPVNRYLAVIRHRNLRRGRGPSPRRSDSGSLLLCADERNVLCQGIVRDGATR